MKKRSQVIADLLEKPGHLIRRAHQMSVAIFETNAAPYSITAPQHVVMTALFKHPGVDQVTLAGLIALDKVTTGSIVTRLVGRGLVRREQSAHDGRARALFLSDEGTALLVEMQQTVRQAQKTLLARLSPADQKTLLTLLRKMMGVEEDLGPLERPKKGVRARPAPPN
ncbi:MAG TPA: MarR family winged helix-turn-helix transcriptional regulator [Pseudorhodoferax sp.]|jgi:DNA-binding MarR family transcriptional regulator|nr:MarR family winged helix-turn-helix transcriptional regulator [Pseudorhodoferax sp.]